MKMSFEEYRNASKRPRDEPRRVVRKSYDPHKYDGSDPDAGEVS